MTNFEEDISVYNFVSILGECFQNKASVNLVKHYPTGRMLAVKRFHLDKIWDNISIVQQEITLTKQLQHPNIITYYTSFVHGPEVFTVSSLQAFGSCKSLLDSHFNEGLPELAIILIFKDIIEAVNYLHKSGFIHRAIRASHILISASGKASLSGLHYACPLVINGRWQRAVHSFPLSTQPNLNWLSPELLEQNLKGYNEKSDIYSLGILCCELANGREPFADIDSTLMLVEKVRGCIPGLLDCTTVPSKCDDRECQGDCDIEMSLSRRGFSQYLHEFCYMCLEREAKDRPSAAELLTHPVFSLVNKGLSLPELLKPVLPLSDKVSPNKEEMCHLDHVLHMSEMDMPSCDWDFPIS